jgi:hypothetical protein
MRTIGNAGSTARKLEAVASGALPNGQPVIVNADGTVSAVTVSETPSVGSPVVFESAQSNSLATTFDSNSNKVVIAYQDDGNSDFCTAVVGTVSGDSISFGTPVVVVSAASAQISATFDSNSNKIVIAYRDFNFGAADAGGFAIVGTVSGTSISFGTPVATDTYNDGTPAVFDSSTNKVVISYRKGLEGGAFSIVGTVSGTSISFGTKVQFLASSDARQISSVFDNSTNRIVNAYFDEDSTTPSGTAIVGRVSGTSIIFGTDVAFATGARSYSTAFDDNSNKVVICYTDNNNSSFGTAIVGTVSGTSISFGTPVVFSSSATQNSSAVFDSSTNKIVVFYRDQGNSNFSTVVVGVVSGTSISFGTPVVVVSATSVEFSSTFDIANSKIVTAYRDGANSFFGTSLVLSSETSTLTAENYIGLASNGYPDTATATIDVQGAINDRQSGLTAGQAYYVQTDGTLGTTPAGPSVFAGTAISATKMIVKG